MLINKETKDYELKKHVGSIHCSNTLSLLQRKISNVLLYHAYDELLEKEEHSIAIKTLCTLIGYSSHDYDGIKKALKALISTVLEWNLLEDSKGNHEEDWNASSILASVGIKGGICSYAYSHRLKKLLYMPEIYGRINITIQSRFKSNYGLALYENCVRYQNLPYTRWFTLATFRKLMGVPDNKYTIFRDFKRRVLDKSVEEINLYADIHVEPEIERVGHQVNRIRFKLNQSNPVPNKDVNQTTAEITLLSKNDTLVELIEQFCFSRQGAQKVLDDFGHSYIRDKIALVKKTRAFKQNKVKNYAAYLRSALNEDFLEPLIKQNSHSDTFVQNKIKSDLTREYAEFVANTLDELFESFNDNMKVQLLNEFQNYLKKHNNTFVLDKYANKGFNNRIVKSIFRTFLREEHPSLIPDCVSFEQFSLQNKKE